MTVGPDLLRPAEANDHSAVDMVSIWASALAELGGSLAPGLWMHSGAQARSGQGRPACCSIDLLRLQFLSKCAGCAAQINGPCHLHSRRTRHNAGEGRQGRCGGAANSQHVCCGAQAI